MGFIYSIFLFILYKEHRDKCKSAKSYMLYVANDCSLFADNDGIIFTIFYIYLLVWNDYQFPVRLTCISFADKMQREE